ncbi:tripartite tricarboxylate transporter substrate-binding protein [Siccirubricoccus deserti]
MTSAERNSAAPDIPTMAEFFPGFEITSWGSLVGPAGIPAPLVERMSSLTKQALQDPGLRRSLRRTARPHGGRRPRS